MAVGGITVSSEKYDTIFCNVLIDPGLVGSSLSADVSNAIYWVTETSRGLSVCEEKQDRLVFFNGLQREMETNVIVHGVSESQ